MTSLSLVFFFSLVSKIITIPKFETECPPTHYYKNGFQLQKSVNFSEDCLPKREENLIYDASFYLRNEPCSSINNPSSCQGTYENPFDDFWKLMEKIHTFDQVGKYFEVKLKIFFIGSPHFLKYNEILESSENNIRFFQGFNANILIGPLICNETLVKNCLIDNEKIDLYMKTDLIQFDIQGTFKMYNMRLFGNDIILNPAASVNLTCFMQSFICCDEINDYPECNISNKKLDFIDENYYYQSLFLIRDNVGYADPNISFFNISFINFNCLRKEGWRTLILINRFSMDFILNNAIFSNCFLSHGLMKTAFLDLYQNNQNSVSSIAHIAFLDIKIEKYNAFEIQENQLFNSKGLFQFSSGTKFMLSMNNFILQSINVKNSIMNEKYCLFFENSDSFNQVEIIRLSISKVIGLGFIHASFTIIQAKEFYFLEITIIQTPIFSVKNQSIIYLESGIINNSISYATFFSSSDGCQIILNSTHHYNLSNAYGSIINSGIFFFNSSFYIIKLEKVLNFLMLQDSNCSFVRTSFDNLISNFLSQSFFKVISVINLNFLNVEGTQFTNIKASSCFTFESINFIPKSIINIYDVEVYGSFGISDTSLTNINFFFIVSLTSSIHTISIRNALFHDCETFSLIELRYYLIMMNLINVEFKNLTFSYAGLMNILVQDINMNDQTNSLISMEKIIVANSTWKDNVFLIASFNRTFTLTFFDCIVQSIFAYKFIELQSSEKSLKIFLKNVKIIKIEPKEKQSNFFFIFSNGYALDLIHVENATFYTFSGSFIFLIGKFNNITFKSFSGFNIFNKFRFFTFSQIFDKNANFIQKSKIWMSEMFFKDFFISLYPSIECWTRNVPIDFEFVNSTFELVNTNILFVFVSNSQLINIKIRSFNMLSIRNQNYFILLYLSGIFLSIDLENIYIFQGYNPTLMDLREIFNKIIIKNVVISTIFYVDYYMVIVTQQISDSLDYTEMNIENFTLINIGFETTYYSPISLFLIWQLDNLIISNIKVFDISTITKTLQGTSFVAEFENLKYVSLSGLIFIQTIWVNFDQTLKFHLIDNLYIGGSHFEMPLNPITLIRRFQAVYVLHCTQVIFENNLIIGMSTVEKPQFIYEETGVASFLVESTYEQLNNFEFTLIFKNNTILNNYGIKYGIIGIVGFSNVYLQNNIFDNSEALYGGVLACISVSKLYIENNSISNSASRSEGGGLYFSKIESISIIKSKFSNTSSQSDAGCIYLREIGSFYLNLTLIENSLAMVKGGIFYIIKTNKAIIKNIKIFNSLAEKGGVFYIDEKTNLNAYDSYFEYGCSDIAGGLAYIYGDEMTIYFFNNIFNKFNSKEDGAIIYSSNIRNLTLSNCLFSNSVVINSGLGIIYLEGYSNEIDVGNEKVYTFENNLFLNNSAFFGAIIYYSSNSLLIISNLTCKLARGSLFSLESDLNGKIYMNYIEILLTNYNKNFISDNSLIILLKCSIFIKSANITFNFGRSHLFKAVNSVLIEIEFSSFIDYFIMKNENSSAMVGSSDKLFYIYKSQLRSTKNFVSYSKLYESSINYECSFFDIRESVLRSYFDYFSNISSKGVLFFMTTDKSNIAIMFASLIELNPSAEIFFFKESFLFFSHSTHDIKSDTPDFYFMIFDGMGAQVQLTIENCQFNVYNASIIYIANAYMINFSDSVFNAQKNDSVLKRGIQIKNSLLVMMNEVSFQNFFHYSGSCIYITAEKSYYSNIHISKSLFNNNTAFSAPAIFITGNIFLNISNAVFSNNKAILKNELKFNFPNSGKGGCIIIDCEYFQNCSASFTLTVFKNNYADSLGPTIISKSPSKVSIETVTFYGNSDGLSFSTKSVRFPMLFYVLNDNLTDALIKQYFDSVQDNLNRTNKLISIYELNTRMTIASGQPFNFSLLLTDLSNQQIITDSSIKSTLNCKESFGINTSQLLLDKDTAISKKGIIQFEFVSIIYFPNSILDCKIEFYYSDEIFFKSSNPEKKVLDRFVKVPLYLYIRNCLPGELYQNDESCYKCKFGTYALHEANKKDYSKKCLSCPSNAYCDGGNNLSPLYGYWRINNKSSLIQKCPTEEGCLGVGEDINLIRFYGLIKHFTEEQKIHGVCKDGYWGNLCYYCRKGMARFKQRAPCQDCDSLVIIYIKMALALIFMMAYISIQAKIFSNVEQKDPHLAILSKLLLSHLQTISMMDLIDLGWTYDFSFYFSIKDYLSFLSEDFFVIDCIIKEWGGDLLVNKIIFTIALPLLLSAFMFVFWTTGFFYIMIIKKSVFSDKIYNFLVEKMRITFLIFIFILYPEILKKGFSLINCTTIDENTQLKVLAQSPNMECWSSQHVFWVLTVSLPGILLWGILAPILILMILIFYHKSIFQAIQMNELKNYKTTFENDPNKKGTLSKKVIINIQKDLAEKLFASGVPPAKHEIGYKQRHLVFIESQEIKIVESKAIDQMSRQTSTNRKFKLSLPSMNKKSGRKGILKEIKFQDSNFFIKQPDELVDFLRNDGIDKNSISENDLRENKVFIQEKYELIYDYEKKMAEERIFPDSVKEIDVSNKTQIIVRNLGFIFRGYKKDRYFWEIVMFSKKFFFIFIGIFTEAFPQQIKPTMFLTFLSFYIYLQLSYQPYQFDYLNNLEMLSLIITFSSAMIGFLLFSTYFQKYSIIFVVLVLLLNILIFIYWLRMLFKYGRIKEKVQEKWKNILIKMSHNEEKEKIKVKEEFQIPKNIIEL